MSSTRTEELYTRTREYLPEHWTNAIFTSSNIYYSGIRTAQYTLHADVVNSNVNREKMLKDIADMYDNTTHQVVATLITVGAIAAIVLGTTLQIGIHWLYLVFVFVIVISQHTSYLKSELNNTKKKYASDIVEQLKEAAHRAI